MGTMDSIKNAVDSTIVTADTIVNNVVNEPAVADTVQKVSKGSNYFDPSVFLTNTWYWIGAAIMILIILFIKKYVYWKYDNGSPKRTINNFLVILVVILAMIPIVKWAALIIGFFIVAGVMSESSADFYFDDKKFFSNGILNFLFSTNYKEKRDEEPKKKEESKNKNAKEGLNDL